MKSIGKTLLAASGAFIIVMTFTISRLDQFKQTSPTDTTLVDVTNDLTGVKKVLDKLERRMRSIATSLEQLWCATRRIGGTGSFCINTEHVLTGGNHVWDVQLCKGMEEVFGAASVVDFGAGLGHYGRCFLRRSDDVFKLKKSFKANSLTNSFLTEMGDHINTSQVIYSWHGYDGAVNVDELSEGFIGYQDLTEEDLWLGRRWDWVVSLEVGEHIPRVHEDVFLYNLARHSCQGIVMSWAIPGQGGHHHVNERPNSYIKSKMAAIGFDNDMKTESFLRNITNLIYVVDTLMVFRNREASICTLS